MFRFLAPAAFLVCLVACGSSIRTSERVRSDLMDYLSNKVGLDMKALDVDVTKVQFEGSQARATVSFHQKNDSSINSAMTMNYKLAEQNGHWVVTGRSDSQGLGARDGQTLPPGHPSVGNLPPGHPSVPSIEQGATPATPQDNAR